MENQEKPTRNKFHFFQYYLHDESNDIQFRGPISYRHLRIAGWVCMMFMAMSIIFVAFAKIRSSEPYRVTSDVFNSIGNLALPLFLIANFSFILRHHNQTGKLLKFHGLTALGLIAVAYLFLFRYVFTVLTRYQAENYQYAELLVNTVINTNPSRYVFLNMFIDLFLCSLSFTFLTYHPKKVFTGKKLIIFRLFVLFPMAYELTCVILKVHTLTNESFMIPWYVFPFLTTKPPFLLLGFLIITVVFSLRKYVYMKHNHTSAEYDKFLKTNANSLQISIIIASVLLFVAFLDLITFVAVSYNVSQGLAITLEEAMKLVGNSGIGQCISVVLIVPVILLFSYSREYKPSLVDKIIPVAGVALCIYAALESLIQLIGAF